MSYLRLRRSTYSDAASADTAAMARPLNSGTVCIALKEAWDGISDGINFVEFSSARQHQVHVEP